MRAFAFLAFTATAWALPASYIESNEGLLWASFKETYNKVYTGSDEARRRAIFKENLLQGAEREKRNPRATFGVTKFSDLTEEEFNVMYKGYVPKPQAPVPERIYTDEEVKASLDSVDWRAKGAVTHVKSQGRCGSCWSFSATGGIEGQWALAGNPLTSLSEQELVSCDTNDGGCKGGQQDRAWKWLVNQRQGQIVTEASYPYTSGHGASGTCELKPDMEVGATIRGYKDLPHDEDQMAAWVSRNGPLSIGVDAQWHGYKGGIMDDCQGTRMDHAVLIVGYGADYWIVKNSWGPNWGESGYIRLARGSNQCGLTGHPCYPIV